ncbi:hypothetical protein TNCV_2603291 [Trichonephila clavipes]|nr:hypothetical protein TNCV_2603291 [Trichonephila clavipes]
MGSSPVHSTLWQTRLYSYADCEYARQIRVVDWNSNKVAAHSFGKESRFFLETDSERLLIRRKRTRYTINPTLLKYTAIEVVESWFGWDISWWLHWLTCVP